jgi:hypothetical protein
LASNNIEQIKTSLDKLQNLTDLNLAGNKICSFKEILNLARLTSLKSLAFFDPHYGENPICSLCNYQTFVLYHLSSITKLDTLHISEEAKAFAEATFMKKKMYYNMRIKTLQRVFSTAKKVLRKAKHVKMSTLADDLPLIQKRQTYLHAMEKKAESLPEYTTLKSQFEEKLEELNSIRDIYSDLKKEFYDFSQTSIHRLVTELETGGNIRCVTVD